jgi:hypothetical protein
MRHRSSGERRCTYLVVLQREFASTEELHDLAGYLSSLSVCNFDIAILDTVPTDENRRVFRWVGRYIPTKTYVDPVRAAFDVASCEKVIVADGQIRYSQDALDHLCALLDLHEVVEPQDYFDPLPWWGGLEAGRMLLRRGIGPLSEDGMTFGFRKRAVRGLRSIDGAIATDHPVRRLESHGAEVFSALDIFVRRIPPTLDRWLRDRPRQFDQPAIFFGVLPLALILATLSGLQAAALYLGVLGFCGLVLAIRGRIGAAPFFPLRACFFGPVWLLERSISVYWALLLDLTGTRVPDRIPMPAGGELSSRPSSTANTL